MPFANTPAGIQAWIDAYPSVLDAVWVGFDSGGEWPVATDLTRHHATDSPRVNFLGAAREMPAALGRAQLSRSALSHEPVVGGQEAIVLRPFALTFVPAAQAMLAAFELLIQVAVSRYIDIGEEPVIQSSELSSLLSVDETQARRIEELIAMDSWLFRPAGGEAGSLRIEFYDHAVLQLADDPVLDHYFAMQGQAWWPETEDTSSKPVAVPTPPARPSTPPPELTAAASMQEVLAQRGARAKTALVALVEASAIRTFKNDPASGIFIVPTHPYSWAPLARADIPLLGAARQHGEDWNALSRLVIAVAASEHLDEFDKAAAELRRIYLRGSSGDGPSSGTLAAVTARVEKAISSQLRLIDELPGSVEPSELLIVPDTNALLADPALEAWVLGNEPATIVVPQQVVAELDRKKAEGNDKVARKAESIIRRFREYGRRGNTLVGVKLVGKRSFKELPHSPDMSLMPDSFDPDHADDRILATAVALSATHVSSRVVLVTRDRNLQNKARLQGIPAVDVTDL